MLTTRTDPYINARPNSKCISSLSDSEQISFEIWNEGKKSVFLMSGSDFQRQGAEQLSALLSRVVRWNEGTVRWGGRGGSEGMGGWGGDAWISYHKMAACTLLTDLFHLGLGPAPEFQSISEGTWCRFSPLWDIWPATFRNHGLLVSTWRQGESSRG